jgi:hypothetical protein
MRFTPELTTRESLTDFFRIAKEAFIDSHASACVTGIFDFGYFWFTNMPHIGRRNATVLAGIRPLDLFGLT